MTLASDNTFPKVILAEGAAPATPSSGQVKLYAKADGLLYSKDDAGAETLVSGGSGGLSDHNHTGGGDGGDLDSPIIDGFAIFNEESAPSTPSAGTVALYAKSDGLFYSKDDAGTETLVSGGAGGGGGGLTQAFAGYNTIGGTTETPGANSKLYFKKVTLANACLLTSIDAYVGTSGAGAVLGPVAALYDDSAGSPGKVIAWQSEFGVVGDFGGNFRWLAMPIGAWLAAADYWLAVRTSDSGGAVLCLMKYDAGADLTGTGVVNVWKDASNYTLSNSSRQFSIRANTIR